MTFLCSEGKNISLTSCKEKRSTLIFIFKCYETFYFNVFYYKLSFSIIQEGLFVCEVTFFVKPKLSLYGKLVLYFYRERDVVQRKMVYLFCVITQWKVRYCLLN